MGKESVYFFILKYYDFMKEIGGQHYVNENFGEFAIF